MALKYSDLIKQYEGIGDFAEWVEKFELVAKLQNVKDWSVFLPLFLSEGAFSVYKEISDEDKKCYTTVKQCLLRAFSRDQFSAYADLSQRKCRIGESVDVYLADVKRLVYLANGNETIGVENWIKCAFVAGLPENAQHQLKLTCSLSYASVEDILIKARDLMRCEELYAIQSCAIGESKKSSEVKGIVCFNCQRTGHISRYCPDKLQDKKRPRKCYLCNSESHLLPQCPKRDQIDSKNGF